MCNAAGMYTTQTNTSIAALRTGQLCVWRVETHGGVVLAGVVACEGVRPLVPRGQARTECEKQSAPVLVAHHAVQQEVTGGVHCGQEVEDVAEAQHDGTRGAVLVRVVEDVHDEHHRRRGLTDDKEYDDCNQRGSDLVLLPLPAAARTVPGLHLLEHNNIVSNIFSFCVSNTFLTLTLLGSRLFILYSGVLKIYK